MNEKRPKMISDAEGIPAGDPPPAKSGTVGTHPASVDTHPDTVGTHPASAGTHPASAGTRPGTADNRPGTAGTRPASADTHPDTVGTHPASADTHPASAGADPSPAFPERIRSYPVSVRIVIGKLAEAGYSAYMVGGCVRDALLSREPHDWDVTTSALPDEMLRVFEAFRTIPTGIRHGTVSVLIDGMTVEVTTFRSDGIYSDGRHPDQVTFATDLEEDLSRRDFTVNAMAYNETEGFIDLFGGRDDLAARRIRAVGDPVTRFSEDALRLLRAVRFSAQLGFSVEQNTLAAIRECRAGLSRISAERIRDELLKILVCPRAGDGMALLASTGLLPYVLPGMERLPDGVSQKALDILPAEPELRLAYLLRPLDGARAEEILRFLKPSGAFAGAVRLLRTAALPERIDRPSARRFYVKYGDLSEFALAIIGVTATDGYTMEAADTLFAYIGDALAGGDCLSLSDLALSGSDLIAAGYAPSPMLGKLLSDLFSRVLEDPGLNEKQTLLAMAKEYREEN